MSASEFQPILRDASSGEPARRRPVGVTAAAIVLGLLASVAFLVACFTLRVVLLRPHIFQSAIYSAWVCELQVGMMVVFFLLSSVAACVVIGLFRMKRWARLGILILGGYLAVFYGAVAIGLVFASNFYWTHSPLGSHAAMIHFVIVRVCQLLLMASIGLWWLVYFNLPRIRKLFVARGLEPGLSDNAFMSPAETLPLEDGR
jgi:hypothetical protein